MLQNNKKFVAMEKFTSGRYLSEKAMIWAGVFKTLQLLDI